MKVNKINNKYIVAIIISLIIGCSIFGYGYFSYKKEVLIQKQMAEKERQKMLQDCLDKLQQGFVKGVNDMGNFTSDEAKIMLDVFWKEKEECFKRYPTN